MQLPCELCGGMIPIPAKYRRAKMAVHPHCLDLERYLDSLDDSLLPKEQSTPPTK